MKAAREIIRKHTLEGTVNVVGAMKEFADNAVEEQRKSCAHVYFNESLSHDSLKESINGKSIREIVKEEIENAPKPDIR